MAKEKNLTSITTVAAADFARIVTSAGASVKATAANLAKYIVETYNGSTVAGSAQSVKSALDSLNSKLVALYQPAGVAIPAGTWVDDPFSLPTPSGNRYILSVYDGAGNFGFLSKRSSDGKILSSIALTAVNAIAITGVAK